MKNSAIPKLSTAQQNAFWCVSIVEQFVALNTSVQGLTTKTASLRLAKIGANRLDNHQETGNIRLFLAQFKRSIIPILLFATGLSFFLNTRIDAAIIMTIVIISGCLGFWQEKGAADAIKQLLAMVQITVMVLRDSLDIELAAEQLVPSDVIQLQAGDVIPADCLLMASDNLFVDEAILTGESYPAEKLPGVLAKDTPLSQRSNALWMGTHVQSGSGTALVIATGTTTEFGQLSQRLKFKTPETEFERSVRRFGYLLMEVTLILVMLIFAVNVYLAKPIVDSFLFALALAVGLTPQLLPAVISVNLARGAKRMAAQKVIVKQLAAIENFGSMNVLCSDKTGTLTEGVVHLHGALDISGQPSDKVARYAYLNATFENGFNNPIDEAICLNQQFDSHNCQKLAEIPYDFYRKRLSVLMIEASGTIIVTICSDVELADGAVLDIKAARAQIDLDFQSFSRQGYRTLGLAYKVMGDAGKLDKTDEINMRLFGYLLFRDPPKAGCTETIQHLHELGVALKIITCDNHLVAATIGKELGLGNRQVVGDSNIQHRELAAHEMLTGPEIDNVGDLALINRVGTVHLFSEVEPNQKERIIIALKKAGNVVGYMGDGINDVSALHAADVGISVDSAADATKESAQIVLLEKDLGVLIQGIKEGRVTFANTLKYVFMATSSNFGNMFSMAGASLFLPFLPLLPKQILLTDLPEMTIATDTVDSDMVAQPRRWDIRFIRQFMMTFGLVSSLFDFMTFGLLLLIDVTPEQFRTGWFVESVISAALIVFVVRSSKPFFKTRPGRYLLQATLAIVVITVALPYSPIAPVIGFVPLPLPLMAMLGLIVTLYLASAELTKHFFYRMVKI